MALDAARLREVLHYDPETGVFTWAKRISIRIVVGKRAGYSGRLGYRQIRLDKHLYQESHLAWMYVYGVLPKQEIDHINVDPTDNRISNLREADRRLNCENKRRPLRNNKLGFLGVVHARGRKGFTASIRTFGKTIFLGTFESPELAHEAYCVAKRQYHAGSTI